MKIGAENKTQLRLMIALVAIAIPVVIYNFWDTGSTSSAAPPATTTVTPTQKRAGASQVVYNPLDPRLHLHELAISQQVKYEAGRNIFTWQAVPIEPLIADVKPRGFIGPPPEPTPTPTPPPPPIDLKFYGFANKPNEPKRVFLQQGQDLYIAKQGEIVKSRYKVIQISSNSVMIEDVLYNNRQPIPLTTK